MNHRGPRARQVFRLLMVALVAAIGVLGLLNGPTEWTVVESAGQRVATITEIAYGLFGLLAAAGLFIRHRWTVRLLLVWAVAVVVTAGMAPVVWGGAGLTAGLAAGAGTAAIAAGIVWLGRWALTAT